MKILTNKIVKDTLGTTAVSVILQGLGILMNVIVSAKVGTAAVGVMVLIFTIFGFIMVLANGNVYISTSRLVSEELGNGNKNPSQIMKYSLTFAALVSVFFLLLAVTLSGFIAEKTDFAKDIALPIKIISLSLPFAAIGSCIKGYFNAIRDVKIPCTGDIIEFSVKWSFLLVAVLFLSDKIVIYVLIAISLLLGEAVSFIYYLINYIKAHKGFKLEPHKNRINSPKKYLKLSVPIALSGYVNMIMATANDTIVPFALISYNASTDVAMSQYGIFEAMIIPVIFFPSSILCSLSNIIIPEIARAKSADNSERIKSLTHKVLSRAFVYSFFIASIFYLQGENIGEIMSPTDSLVSESLLKLFPVIPFIYLEIVLEGILKGLGHQNFSTINSLFEYIIRIACVLIFVPIYGFDGVLISYYASNIYSNIVRITVLHKKTEMRFSLADYILKPLFYTLSSGLIATALTKLISPKNVIIETVIFICICGIAFIAVYELGKRLFDKKVENLWSDTAKSTPKRIHTHEFSQV